jgi:bifunctional UDP-N-acetylglucosamine pyrophosphorylase/glucosamine-1-phosphate N-acetyltransferase
MYSARPKVLHTLAGQHLLQHVVSTAQQLNPERIVVVYGHGGEQVVAALPDPTLTWVEQSEQRGTGHAVEQALPALQGLDQVLVLYGDVPLIQHATLEGLIHVASSPLALLTVELSDPAGYGRIVRDESGQVLRIVEQKDGSSEELAIKETNTGIMVVAAADLQRWVGQLENSNAQGEFYLTDIVAMAVSEGVEVKSVHPADSSETQGVNDRLQLAQLERHYQQLQAAELMRLGVGLQDPARFDLRGTLQAGQDVEIDINVIIEGAVSLGDGVRVGANTVIRNSTIHAGTVIRENCVIEDATVGEDCRIGPFARIRPETELAAEVHIGNFVEIKKSQVGEGSKINHLSYVGDSDIGSGVNVGAGTITCNYDGANKHRTVIGDNVFIGSDTQLVAPVNIAAGATIGAGSTITKNAPGDALTLSRSKQTSIKEWKRPTKKREGS